MPSYLLDTDVFIHFLRGSNGRLISAVSDNIDKIFLSEISIVEILEGVAHENEKSRRHNRKQQLINSMNQFRDILSFDDRARDAFYGIRRTLYARYQNPLKNRHMIQRAQVQNAPQIRMDLMNAAIARSNDLVVVTRNVKDYSLIPGIQVENWVDSIQMHQPFPLRKLRR